MYTEIGHVSDATVAALQGIVDAVPRWETHESETTSHQASPCTEQVQAVTELVRQWPIDTWQGMSFMRLRPGGNLYRHADVGFGYHIPVETNVDAVSVTYPDGVESRQHLEVGKLYHVDRSIEHESFNDGDSNRTHLIVLLKD
jgi:hypothetical protein